MVINIIAMEGQIHTHAYVSIGMYIYTYVHI